MKNNQRKIGAALSYVTIIANALIQLLYTPFLIGKLGNGEYGLFSLVSSIIGYLTVLDLGFGNAIIVYTAKYREKKELEKERKLHGMFHLIYIIIGIVAGIAGLILSLNTNNIFNESLTPEELGKMRIMLMILSFNLFVTFAFSIYNSIITAREQFVFQKILATINTIVKPLLMIPLLFLGFKSIALCIVITVVNISVLLANYIFCCKKLQTKIKFLGFDKKLFKTVFAYSFFIFLGVIADKINWSADQFILGMFCGTAAVSIYSAASTLNQLFINLSTAVSGVLLPKMSKMIARKADIKEISDEFIKVGRIQYYIVFLMGSGLVLVGKEFIRMWVGTDFDEAYYVALLLILPLCIPLIQNLGLSIMQAMNKFRFRTIMMCIMSVANIIASVFLAKWKGPTGAAVGTAASLLICNVIIMNIYYARVIKLDILRFWKNILGMTIRFMLPLGTTIIFICLTGFSGKLALFVYSGVYVVLYCATAYALCANDYEKGIVRKVSKKGLSVTRKLLHR
ncbi:MAG: oligosaccharide flippase family protein [Candidatus Saccharibacteria bacterium]|nr:oligosaccharide flippase family protein [Candidatus Saccharibacteria bacterium]